MAAPTFGPTGPTQLATVTSVVDGDTIRVSIDGVEYPVRYIGIDSPEPDSPDLALKRLADGATAANAELVEGRQVLLERDISETDRFGRLLRHVWLIDGAMPILVNLELVRRGVAEVTTYPPDEKYVALLTTAKESAVTAKVGIWARAATPAPTPTPVPTPAPVVEVDDTPYEVESGTRTTFRGVVGDYTYPDVSFPLDRVTVRWSVKAPRAQKCRVSWRIEPTFDGDSIHSTVRVDPGKKVSGNRRYATSFADAGFIVDSTCAAWTMSLQAIESSGGGGGGNCDSSYPDVCIPPYPPDLDCPDIEFRRFEVRGPDPHGFDGDNDGIGCESG
jgi:endonuclease YncB( thermonuclease family)